MYLTREARQAHIKGLVHKAHGEAFVPEAIVQVGAIPRTFNSKPMRQVVAALFSGTFGGDTDEIANPWCLFELQATISEWQAVNAARAIDERC